MALQWLDLDTPLKEPEDWPTKKMLESAGA